MLDPTAHVKLPAGLVSRAGSSQDRFVLLLSDPQYIGDEYMPLTVHNSQGPVRITLPAVMVSHLNGLPSCHGSLRIARDAVNWCGMAGVGPTTRVQRISKRRGARMTMRSRPCERGGSDAAKIDKLSTVCEVA